MPNGEFGSDATPWPSRTQQVVFCTASSGTIAVATSSAVPDFETWVLEGVDFYGQISATATVTATLDGPGGGVTWADANVGASASGLLILGSTWRGAMPYGRGQIIQASCFASAFPVAFQVTCWGHIDYVDAY